MNFELCRQQCEYYRDAGVFELCEHPKSAYSIAGKSDWHTIVHMRTHPGLCSEAAVWKKSK